MSVQRRTQADRSAATRRALLDAARPLFAEHGFGGVGTEAIVGAAGVTRGAMYHQFADKTALFEQVLIEVETEAMRRILDAGAAAAADGVDDPIELMLVGASAMLDATIEPEVQRIMLLDGPSVLGWQRWREVCMQYAAGMVEAMLTTAISAGRIAPQPVTALAHVLIGALDEAALYVARADDQAAARAEMDAVLAGLIGALDVGPRAVSGGRRAAGRRQQTV